MSQRTQHVLSRLRTEILNGTRRPGDRLSEVGVAAELDVSRTPARSALVALDSEGLIAKRDGRGYVVRQISNVDVENSVAVRAVLEALAARSLAETGMTPEIEDALQTSLGATEAVLSSSEPIDKQMARFQEANVLFHQTIMAGCGNMVIGHAFERISILPFTALGTLAFEVRDAARARMRLGVGHSQHVVIYDAIRKREAERAEAMMREHSQAVVNYADLYIAVTADAEQALPQDRRILL